MPTKPEWELGFASQETKWYILPFDSLTDTIQEHIRDELEFAKTKVLAINIFDKEILRLSERKNSELKKKEADANAKTYINDIDRNIYDLAGLLAILKKQKWDKREKALEAQVRNSLTDLQKIHNEIRDCEETCLTCRWDDRDKECYSGLPGFKKKVDVIPSQPNLRRRRT